ncbi:MAG: hypothetical protein ACOC6D_06760 [Atribacterota bacterium]
MTKDDNKKEIKKEKRKIETIEYVGIVLFVLALIGLFFASDQIAGIFNAMFNKAFGIFDVFIFGKNIGAAIIVSVMTGRILERLGFTDALMRIFIPIMKYVGVNSAIVVPGVYNILGDVNAAGRIAAPVLVKAKATKDEQKIAIATMVQAPCSFSIFMLGMLALSLAGISVFPVVIITLFLPLVLVPFILKFFWRDTRAVQLTELPKFTPDTPPLPTIFNAAREGAELLFLLIVPAAVVIFAIIGALEYIGIWQHLDGILTSIMHLFKIEPITGALTVLVSNTLAMGQLVNMLGEQSIAPALVLGSFVLANSGFPLQVPFGQIPAVWATISDLNEKEAMQAAVLGVVIRLFSAALAAYLLTPLVT